MDTLLEDQYTFMIVSHSVLLILINISNKSCREYQNTHSLFSNCFFGNCTIFEIMWKNIVELDRPQMTVFFMHFACWITKGTDTHSE